MRGDALKHVAGKNVEVFGLDVVELYEAAAVGEVAVEFAQFRGDLQGFHCRHRRGLAGPQGIDEVA